MNNRYFIRQISLFLVTVMIVETLSPVAAVALTGGPAQPEFSTFTPVSSDNLVTPFSGDFTYNIPAISIPGPNGMGYALSLSYNSGASVEDEASWVGFGWTLNPGSITRVKRGFPDDYKGQNVTYWNNVKDNWTATVTKRLGVEALSRELIPSSPLAPGSEKVRSWAKLNGFMTHRYNSYRGYGYSWGAYGDVKGIANLGYTENDGIGAFNYSINPIGILEKLKVINLDALRVSPQDSWYGGILKSMAMSGLTNALTQSSSRTGLFGMWNFNDYSMPTNTTEYKGTSVDVKFGVEVDFGIPVGPEVGVGGSYTTQKSVKKRTRKAYGFMYSGAAMNDDDAAMDYYLEKEALYQKRDKFLSIPFSNADHFIASGEGVSGTFKLHHKKPGMFRPPKASSGTDIVHVNGDLHLGGTIGAGGDIGYGYQKLEVNRLGDWQGKGSYEFIKSPTADEPYFFRFIDDLGGSVELGDNDKPVDAKITTNLVGAYNGIGVSNVYVSRFVNRADPSNQQSDTSTSQRINLSGSSGLPIYTRAGRSAYIGFTTNRDMVKVAPLDCYSDPANENWGGPYRYKSYTQRQDVLNAVKRDDPAIADQIGEFSIVKEDGTRYNYSLPVYSRDEFSLQYGLKGAGPVSQNFLAYHYVPKIEDDRVTLVGNETSAPYASSFLITEILSPDYVDRTHDGPTPDDLGGYVRFNYTRVAGTTDKSGGSLNDWYRWRTPYTGLYYQRNDFSDPYDDMGTVSGGYKELYYLKSIETKTHIAIFTTEQRDDAIEAHHDEQTAATSPTAKGTKRSHKLKKIELFSKNARGDKERLLATVNLQHGYDLCKGLPNAVNSTTGKLTLKKLWFEYDGVKSPDITPYEFGYDYRESSYYTTNNIPKTGVGEPYRSIATYGDAWASTDENPNYSSFNSDRWGNYQYDGAARHNKYNPWVDQTPAATFDPAAWQLKWIRLPAGGEMQVHYEQDDYRYVQHLPAMAMVNLVNEQHPTISNAYRLNVNDVLGIDVNTDRDGDGTLDLQEYADQLKRYYLGANSDQRKDKDHTYFKFLYALEGVTTSLSSCAVEYLTGYIKIKDVILSNNKLWVVLGNTADDHTLPHSICENYVRTQRGGIIKLGGCDAADVGVPEINDDEDVDDGWEAIWWLLGDFGPYYDDDDNCRAVNYDDSYLKLPIPETRSKLGGGIRVKRVLMVDKGLEGAEDAALYGTEYLYEALDGGSSGVATNEPGVGREENALIGLIDKRDGQNWYEKIFAGEDRSQHEGPLGESIMSAASVGYSRVVAKGIHSGKTSSGYAINEFYTARDYPFDLRNSNDGAVQAYGVEKTGVNAPTDIRYDLLTGIINYTFSSIRRAQGFRFVIYDMHGKPKRAASYLGNYIRGQESATINETKYEYFKPGEKIPVMFGSSVNDTVGSSLGKQMEVVYEGREVSDVTNDGSLTVDFGLGLLGFIPFPFASGSIGVGFSNTSNFMTTFTATKIVRYPVIQKRMTTVKDGVTDVAEYIAFDRFSGKPLLVSSADGYDKLDLDNATAPHVGEYFSHTIPATWMYKGMGQKAASERAIIYSNGDPGEFPDVGVAIDKRYDKQGSAESHYLTIRFTKPGAEAVVRDILSSGDLISIFSGEIGKPSLVRHGLYYVGNIAGNRVQLIPTSFSWRTTEAEQKNVNVEIVQAGRGNRLNIDAGNIVTYRLPPIVTQHPQ